MSDDRLEREVERFLASAAVGGIEFIPRDDVRRIIERALACAWEEWHRALPELTPDELTELLEERLPRRYEAGDRLARRSIDVLRTYLRFLEDEATPGDLDGLNRALEACAERFREIVQNGTAHLD